MTWKFSVLCSHLFDACHIHININLLGADLIKVRQNEVKAPIFAAIYTVTVVNLIEIDAGKT